MSEKFSHPNFDRIIGVTAKDDAEELTAAIDDSLDEGGEFIQELELFKTEQDLKIIDFVIKSADEILSFYGREKVLPIDYDHIHLLPKGGVEKINANIIDGAHDIHLGSVLVDRTESDFDFVLTLFHELMHMKSYKALQVTVDGKLAKYRGGWSVVPRDGETNYFNSLEEAVIDFLTEKFYRDYLSKADFVLSDGVTPEYKTNRSEEREFLDHVVDVISEKSELNKDEILLMFINAQVTGNFLGLAKIIEKYVGKGTFRELAETSGDNGA